MEVALAQKPEVVRLAPTAAVAAVAPVKPKTGAAGGASVLPEKTEQVADAYSRGEFCMGTGKDDEAITAFQEAVKIDPSFADAWSKLAALYEKTGQDKLAMEAFKHSKTASGTRASLTN